MDRETRCEVSTEAVRVHAPLCGRWPERRSYCRAWQTLMHGLKKPWRGHRHSPQRRSSHRSLPEKRQHYETGSAGHQPLGRWCGPSHALHMADTQALQCCLMLIACNASYPQAWLAAHCREVVVWERARALARELDRALSDHALERHCTILPTVTLAMRAAYLSRARPGFPGHVRRDLPGPSGSSVRD